MKKILIILIITLPYLIANELICKVRYIENMQKGTVEWAKKDIYYTVSVTDSISQVTTPYSKIYMLHQQYSKDTYFGGKGKYTSSLIRKENDKVIIFGYENTKIVLDYAAKI